MNRILDGLTPHWFPALLLALALVLGVAVLGVWRRRRGPFPTALAGVAAVLALLGIGGFLPWALALWALVGVAAVLFLMLLVLIVTGYWHRLAAAIAGAVLALAVGGVASRAAGDALAEGWKVVRGIEFLNPWWLALLALIPLIIWFSRRSLAGLGPVRSKVAIALRCLLVLFLALALAEARIRQQTENTTVIFVVDRTQSIPQENDPDLGPTGVLIDRRWERLKKFINDAVEFRGAAHERDKAGLIAFGRRPRLELPPSDAPRFNFTELSGNVDGNYTDIAAAIKLALASFPENTGKRIVLISDGNENLGNAEEQALLARQNGVQIDVLPLAAGQKNENEVLVQSIEAPGHVEQGSQLPIRVLVRSMNPNLVVGTLTVKQTSSGVSDDVPGSPKKNVILQPGLNTFTFKQPLTDEQRSYTYEAEFQPEAVVSAEGQVLQRGAPGDRVQNNRATTHVVARGQRRILLVEGKEGEHKFLIKQLEAAGTSKFVVESKPVDKLPPEKGALAAMLSEYDCVILANVAASDVTEDAVAANAMTGVITDVQQEVIRSNTHDQGCGLIMIGGPNGFGAGGWQGTPVEKALPVNCDIKALEVSGKGGLVLIMHASELADGNRWQKQIAKLAIKKLTPNDEVGVMQFDFTGANTGVKWHIPLQEIGEKREVLLGMVDSMIPGDMPDVGPFLRDAYRKLTEEKRQLATKHVIFISDGDPQQTDVNVLRDMRANKVTCTTVGVATHGAPQDQSMAAIARATGGRFYNVKNPAALPEIYTQETRLVSQSFIYERQFPPRLVYRSGPTEALPDQLAPLYGFVRTTPKDSPLVETPIVSPPFAGQEFPILSYWYYGLGKAAAFTADARSGEGKLSWDRDWAKSGYYGKFWEQVLDWVQRPTESRKLVMTTEYRDGKVRVIVDARDDGGRPMVNLNLQGKVTTPANKIDEKGLKFEQKNSGVYEAEFRAEEAGSYFITAGPTRKVQIKDDKGNVKAEHEVMFDRASAGVTIPYSPEYSDLESNTALLRKLQTMTDGQEYKDDAGALAAVAHDSGEGVFRQMPPRFRSLQPVWYWLLVLTGVLLFFDVAVRRLAVDPLQVTAYAQGVWDHLRGRRTSTERAAEFFERLKTRKAQVVETIDRGRAGRRFEGEEVPAGVPPAGAQDIPVTAPPTRRPSARTAPGGVGPQAQEDAADAMSRLMKAKKKVWQDRDKKKE